MGGGKGSLLRKRRRKRRGSLWQRNIVVVRSIPEKGFAAVFRGIDIELCTYPSGGCCFYAPISSSSISLYSVPFFLPLWPPKSLPLSLSLFPLFVYTRKRDPVSGRGKEREERGKLAASATSRVATLEPLESLFLQ